MLKQLACAAASNSSGEVWAAAPSVRAFQLKLRFLNVTVPELVVPLPDIRSPSHVPDAPRLLKEAFERPSWKGELIVFSGVTDCYQPLEASYRLTRGCLEVCAEYRNPVGIITKAPLIERDLDLLQQIKASVTVSIPI